MSKQLPWKYVLLAVGVMALIASYVPYIDYLSDKDVHAEACEEAQALYEVNRFVSNTDPFSQIDHQMLSRITIIGDNRLGQRPVLELPVVYDGVQMPLGQHPALLRIISRDEVRDAMAFEASTAMMARFCYRPAPLSLHHLFVDRYQNTEPFRFHVTPTQVEFAEVES